MLKAICRIENSKFVDRQIRSNFYVLKMEVIDVIEGSQESLIREPFQPLFCVHHKSIEPDLYMCIIEVQIAGVTDYMYHGIRLKHKSTLNKCISVSELSNQLKEKYV